MKRAIKQPRKVPPTPEQVAMFGHIAARLREVMRQRGWDINDLNAAMSKPKCWKNTYNWVGGKGAPSDEFRPMLSQVTGIPEADLMRRKLNAPAKQQAIEGPPVQVAPAAQVASPPPAQKRSEVLTFNIDDGGQARIRLDVLLPLAEAMPLMRLLLDAEAVKRLDA